ncbi:MAG: [FeFe] hydrogenase H-cluster radical SAM maturase HydE [Desulfovibrio sp.]|nr:[FeFe] hydrogenase H-cluster radical SAM maturase HydE [Desulfovibrio sp.]
MTFLLLDKLETHKQLSFEEWRKLLSELDSPTFDEAQKRAQRLAQEHFGLAIYLRGIVEFTNYCRNECHYCGLQKSHRDLVRYRLSQEEILACCEKGHALGLRTFVLQGGEDPKLSDEWLCQLIRRLTQRFPDSAITLSLGERSQASYAALFAAGARRYLLRHETASHSLYRKLHSPKQSFFARLNCLYNLKALGYQTGVGMLIGPPGQTLEHLAQDFTFIQAFQPEMLGCGPFIPHQATVFAGEKPGSVRLTLYALSLCRLLLPELLLPATTALRTQKASGYLQGILHGCNVIMPNLTPLAAQKHYQLYDGKDATKTLEQSLEELKTEVASLGYHLTCDRGDHPRFVQNNEKRL